jgi:hypothetical protein
MLRKLIPARRNHARKEGGNVFSRVFVKIRTSKSEGLFEITPAGAIDCSTVTEPMPNSGCVIFLFEDNDSGISLDHRLVLPKKWGRTRRRNTFWKKPGIALATSAPSRTLSLSTLG